MLLQDLNATGFRQRLFMCQQREGKPFQVGLPPRQVSLVEKGDHYPGELFRLLGVLGDIAVRTMRSINGEPLAPSIDYSPGPDVLPVSPIDAAVAVAFGDTEGIGDSVDDPRPLSDRKPLWPEKRMGASLVKERLADTKEIERVKALLLQVWKRNDPPLNEEEGKSRAIIDVYDCPAPGKLAIVRTETPDETRKRWQTEKTDENSHHSSIVSNHWHSQAVTAYDLAVVKPIMWTEQEKKFYAYLCEVADWRIKVPTPNNPKARPQIKDKSDLLNATKFYEPEDPKNKALIKDTAKYYATGDFPVQVDQAKTPDKLPLIHFETTGKRASAVG
jgi:hypothetical protein